MRSASVIWGLLVSALALATLPDVAFAEVYFTETQSRYDLSSGLRSKQEIWRSVLKQAPKHDGRTAIGVAQGKPRLKYKSKRKNGRCTVTELQMLMHVNLVLPRWDGIYSAKPELKAYYRCIKKTVVVHEREHSRIWYETARRANKKLRSVLRDVPCDQFRTLASKHFRREISKGSLRQRKFDTADYARRRYQRCHAITKTNMTEAVRFTTAHQEWEPPTGRSAPQWSRPAVERTPVARTTHTRRPIRTAQRPTQQPVAEETNDPSEELTGLNVSIWIGVLILCLAGAMTWQALIRAQGLHQARSHDTDGSWADKVVLPSPTALTPNQSRHPPTRTPSPPQPTFGKRRA